eukprot:TRINITY_DN554_c0_g1_i1.p1 TRINITY_DN554_c0_g1~~TRINITY_DN554_c0_g1_i1.p1  ORF type:complete len:618 (-),score=179.56 TRINITY_DN554_c0_g1_i1:52-1905(-)
MERTNGMEVSTRFNRERHGGGARMVKIHYGEETDEFWEALGGRGDIADAEVGKNYADAIKEYEEMTQLYRFENDSLVPLEDKRVRSLLNTNYSFVLDSFTEFYVWHGRSSPTEQREACRDLAEDLFNSVERPSWVEIEKEVENGEEITFIKKFARWPSNATLSGGGDIRQNSISVPKKKGAPSSAPITRRKREPIKKEEPPRQDVMKMHYGEPIAHEEWERERDDGKSGSLKIWVVEGTSKIEVPESEYGNFYQEKSFLCLYTFHTNDRWNIYFWQGRDTSINDRGTAAGLTLDINKSYCRGLADKIRVPVYSEPDHFMRVFGKMYCVHDGSDRRPLDEVRLYHVRGTCADNTKTFEIHCHSRSLISTDCFILTHPNGIYVWNGKLANEYCMEEASAIADKLAMGRFTINKFFEGNEPNEFWVLLGGKQDYFGSEIPPFKLYWCSNNTGSLQCDQVFDEKKIVQEFLSTNSIFILDLFSVTYVWIGNTSKVFERKIAMEIAKEYVEKAPDNRPKNVPMYIVEGSETPEFAAIFHGYYREKYGNEYGPVDELLSSYDVSFSYEQLKDKSSLPETVDQTRLEDYLSDADFEAVFGVDKATFEVIPKWKQTNLKKKFGLY